VAKGVYKPAPQSYEAGVFIGCKRVLRPPKSQGTGAHLTATVAVILPKPIRLKFPLRPGDLERSATAPLRWPPVAKLNKVETAVEPAGNSHGPSGCSGSPGAAPSFRPRKRAFGDPAGQAAWTRESWPKRQQAEVSGPAGPGWGRGDRSERFRHLQTSKRQPHQTDTVPAPQFSSLEPVSWRGNSMSLIRRLPVGRRPSASRWRSWPLRQWERVKSRRAGPIQAPINIWPIPLAERMCGWLQKYKVLTGRRGTFDRGIAASVGVGDCPCAHCNANRAVG